MPETHSTAYDSKIEGNVIFTRFDAALNWVRKNSLWPMPMGLACCAIELMATAASRFDIARFGAEVMRFSPRQCDVMIVAGTVTYKMALAVKRIWEQMPEPKWCIAMGACASTGGMYRSYAVLQGIDQLIPVDVYVSGCPPRPEALLESISRLLGAKIQSRIEFRHETTFSIQPEDLREVAKFCRDELSFDYLIDISSVDNLGDEPRFEVVYELYSMTLAVHLRLKLAVSEEVCAVDTVSDIWPTADWHERES